MSYEIKEEGFKYRGIKLGQKCIYNGQETFIIGIDVEPTDDFIAIRDSIDDGYPISTTIFNCVVLYGHKNSSYTWVSEDEITLLPFTPSDDSLPSEISPVHAQEILKDAIDETIILHSRLDKLYETIVKCGDIINQHN